MIRPGILIAAALALAVSGLLGFRVLNLEQRVQRLAQAADSQRTGGDSMETNERAPRADSGGAVEPYAAQVQALQKRVAALEQQAAKVAPTGTGARLPIHDEKAVLSIVERENSRVRDVQLEWHHARWVEARAQQVNAFAAQHKLNTAQTSELQRALELEADAMVSVLKDPSMATDPDQSASDWKALLDRTDASAKRVLTPEQFVVWSQSRSMERRVLWPWLPTQAATP
jgi:hypothetical protein